MCRVYGIGIGIHHAGPCPDLKIAIQFKGAIDNHLLTSFQPALDDVVLTCPGAESNFPALKASGVTRIRQIHNRPFAGNQWRRRRNDQRWFNGIPHRYKAQ